MNTPKKTNVIMVRVTIISLLLLDKLITVMKVSSLYALKRIWLYLITMLDAFLKPTTPVNNRKELYNAQPFQHPLMDLFVNR